MYIMYVDESGDCGKENSPSNYYILSGLILPQSKWLETLEKLVEFRRHVKTKYQINTKVELHASDICFSSKAFEFKTTPFFRMGLLIEYASLLAGMDYLRLINVIVDKRNYSKDIFIPAWDRLIQRFENTLQKGNFPLSKQKVVISNIELNINPIFNDHGLIIHDNSDNNAVKKITRKKRRYNSIPSMINPHESRMLLLERILEDPIPKDSADSYFIQSADLCTFLLKQYIEPASKVKKHGFRNKFKILEPICFKQASPYNEFGIVWIK